MTTKANPAARVDDKEREALRQGRLRSAPPVLEIHEAIRVEGEHELERPVTALLVSGLAAGLSMGFSFLAQAALTAGLPEAGWTPLVSKFGYCIGFLIVILGRQQLFTENTLTPILALLSRPSLAGCRALLRLWAVVLLANLAGAALFALFIGGAPVFESEMNGALGKVAASMLEPDASANFFRGILGGWLIAMMVWLLPFAESARIGVIVILTYLVGIGHLSHIIAGSVEAYYGVVKGLISLADVTTRFTLPTLGGNVLGGVTLVALLHHAQVRFDHHHGRKDKTDDAL